MRTLRGPAACANSAMHRGIPPILRAPDESVFHRIEMSIRNSRCVIFRPSDMVLPIAPLPDATLAAADMTGTPEPLWHLPGKPGFDHAPARCEIMVPRRQCPDRVQVIGQHHPSIDIKRMILPRGAHCLPECANLIHQKRRPSRGKGDGKKYGGAGHLGAFVIRHGQTMPTNG